MAFREKISERLARELEGISHTTSLVEKIILGKTYSLLKRTTTEVAEGTAGQMVVYDDREGRGTLAIYNSMTRCGWKIHGFAYEV